MKRTSLLALGCAFFFCMAFQAVNAQQRDPNTTDDKSLKVKKRTVMERYEPEMILSVEKRVELKKQRLATIKKRRQIIDTLDISERKKRRLLKELYQSPSSEKWDKLIADIEFEEDPQD
ncbi:hypothetical protein [Poritiphilus flavus]|uniref:LTXXQ motif family protein n=1 Tax=Poritiphilus flavus TaxID=2697053 RepID=A0A6L9EFX1_9FLAO|nr:hypothetical protein [Poritiphilus flavus]NAS13645.1 hypothetical protein [Poritiphilus flavus]